MPETTHTTCLVAPSVEAIQLTGRDHVFALDDVTISYAGRPAIGDVSLSIPKGLITAFIGPSGCGKSTLLRSLNRMNDLVPGASRRRAPCATTASTSTRPGIDPVEVRRRIGMVFQRPNPFPKSIFDNVAYGPRALGMKGNMAERVERGAAPRRVVGRGRRTSSSAARSASRAASSSGSASRAHSPSSPTCCCSTSRARRSIRSRPRASRS